ncbi:MAG: hypothetical protein Q9182_005799 [Xanthomendoza sp. 2 TL-2023]
MDVNAKPMMHECAVCSKNAVSVCKSCKGTPDATGGQTAVYYCSATCQKKDWIVHKSKCNASKDRRALYRAGDTAKKLFILFAKNIWAWPIDKVEAGVGLMHWVDVGKTHAGEIWKIFDGQRRPQHVKHYFFPFPEKTFPGAQLQEAVLSMGCCNLAIHLMHNFVRDMLIGMYSHCPVVDSFNRLSRHQEQTLVTDKILDMDVEVHEVETRVKKRPIILQRVQQGNLVFTSARHTVFQISLSNKEVYVMDLTAGQYGWQGSVVLPWPIFEAERLDTILEVCEVGSTSKAVRADTSVADKNVERHHDAMDSAKEGFDHYLKEWQRQHISFKTLVRCSEEEFRAKQDLLLAFMTKGMTEIRGAVNKRIETMGVTFW